MNEMDHLFQFYNVEPDVKRAAWVVNRCSGPKDTLHTIVPSGFASYVRICHPAWSVDALDPDDEKSWSALRGGHIHVERSTPLRWDDAATANNHIPDRLMQWSEICSPTRREPGMAGVDPPWEGELTEEMLETLFEIFADYSGENQDVLCGFWSGYDRGDEVRAKFESLPRLQDNLLLNSTISRVRDACRTAHKHRMRTSSAEPNAIWPTTGNWYLAIPHNGESSYFGGPADLVSRIFSAENLETYKALPGDDIWKYAS